MKGIGCDNCPRCAGEEANEAESSLAPLAGTTDTAALADSATRSLACVFPAVTNPCKSHPWAVL